MAKVLDLILKNSDNFEAWVDKTNIGLASFQDVITLSSNSTPDITVGNGYVQGIFGANTLVATILRGGNTTTSNTLNINSNVIFNSDLLNVNTTSLIISSNVYIGNSTSNSTIIGNTFSGIANNSLYLNYKQESALNVNNSLNFSGQPQSYYTNASNLSTGTIPNARILSANTTTAGIVQLVDSLSNTSVTLAPTANSVKNVYDSAIAANTRAASAQTAAISAYSNAVLYASNASNLSTGTIPNARIISANTTTAGIVQLVESLSNTSVTLAPTANSVKNVYDSAIAANTRAFSAQVTANLAYDSAIAANTRAASAQSAAISAYSNSVLYASNASNLSTGIIPDGRISGNYTNITSITIGATVVNSSSINSTNLNIDSGTVSQNFGVLGNLVVNGSLTYAGTSVANGSFIPVLDNTYTLGNSTFGWNVFSVNTTVRNVLHSNDISLNNSYVNSNTITTNDTIPQIIDTFSTTQYRAGKYLLSIKDNNSNSYNSTELMLIHDGSDSYITEYATLNTNNIIGTFSSNVSSTTLRLYYTPQTSSSTIKLYRTLMVI